MQTKGVSSITSLQSTLLPLSNQSHSRLWKWKGFSSCPDACKSGQYKAMRQEAEGGFPYGRSRARFKAAAQHRPSPRGTNTHGKAKGRVTESSHRPAGPRASTRGTRVGPRVPVGRGRPPRVTSSPVRPRAVFKSCTSTRRKQDAVFTILDWSRLS